MNRISLSPSSWTSSKEGYPYELHQVQQAARSFNDQEVSPGYQHGDLPLTRPNVWFTVSLRRFSYHKSYTHFEPYFEEFYSPLLFADGVLSVAQAATQVILALRSTLHLG
jgi:hypothetical protein